MVQGKIVPSAGTPQPSYNYHADMGNIDLPMYLSSGVVTEVAPLMLMLNYHYFDVLFIEEPEIGLHPELQLAMARVLIRLWHAGATVFFTTHSDTILQHINNMIKLHERTKADRELLMERFGYGEADLLDPKEVSMYQFDVSGETGRSGIRRLTSNEYGFEVPTFNNALKKRQP